MDAQVNYTPAEINDSILHSIEAHQGRLVATVCLYYMLNLCLIPLYYT